VVLRTSRVTVFAALLAMENIIIGLIAAACLIYLVVAVLYPEKF
jgi:K+-transporting ATPase KdpF subunit